MKNLRLLALFAAVIFAASSCTSAFYQASTSYGDDLYGVHNQTAIYQKQIAEAQARKAEAEARKAEAEALRAEWQALSQGSSTYTKGDYDTKYSTLLSKFDSDVYVVPDSYSELSYTADNVYTSAYDPAGGTVIIADNVYVSPMYTSSMFGYWGAASYFDYAFYSPRWYNSWYGRPYYYNSFYGYRHYSWGYWNWN